METIELFIESLSPQQRVALGLVFWLVIGFVIARLFGEAVAKARGE